MKNILALILVASSTLIISGCANHSKIDSAIEKEIAAVPADKIKPTSASVKDQINASHLTQEQKDKLVALEERRHNERVALTEEIEKTKVVLLETVLSPKMNEREFNILKKKIRNLDKKRMENGFATLKEVRQIINPASTSATDHNEIYKAVIENRLRGL